MVYDVAIAGLGAMGSAAAHVLAARGQSVIGFDCHAPPHTLGSSHGRTRLIREAYFEHPLYVPLVRRARELWRELESASHGRSLYRETGGLMIGPETGTLVRGALHSAREHDFEHQLLSSGELHRRFPVFTPLDDMVGLLETHAGVLFPERIIATQLALAVQHGADLHADDQVREIDAGSAEVVLQTTSGRYRTRHLIVATGAWTADLLPALALPLSVERQVMHWFQPLDHPELLSPERMPVSMWQLHSGRVFYTKPDFGDGVKVGVHHEGARTSIESIDRTVSPDEDAIIFDLLRRFVPFAKGHIRETSVCAYTNTPDGHFIVDRHPDHARVIVVSACSGHGFKFASAIGEAVADMVSDLPPRFDLSPFALSRFATATPPTTASTSPSAS